MKSMLKINASTFFFVFFTNIYMFISCQSIGQENRLSLDGIWEIIFDHSNMGRNEYWHIDSIFQKQDSIQMIKVPGSWELEEMHYFGLGVSRWGYDLSILSIGEETCIFSQLPLVEYLGKDPVADKIIFNLIDFTSGNNSR